jgi:hypothetical protein
MRRTFLTVLLAMAPAAVSAQVVPGAERQVLPRDVRREVVERWDRLQIDEGHEVRGDVLVRRGPLIIAGHVRGNVLAVNSDVALRPTARIDGDILVIGGELTGRTSARVSGSTRIYRQPLAYREEDSRIVDQDESNGDDNWWRRLERRREGSWAEALRIVQAGPYNRIEGLPIQLGPVVQQRTPWGSLRLEGAAVVRTASSFASDRGDIGHRAHVEVRVGRDRGIGVGGRLVNVVEPVEDWQLSDVETSLAAFVSRHDYRDYYQRHGGGAYVTLYGARDFNLTASYSEQRWTARGAHNPFTIFDGSDPWRPNPQMDEGLFNIAGTSLSFDTRTDPDDPWSGWYLSADVEHGRGRMSHIAPTSTARPIQPGGITDYTRGFFDVRRYNRLGPKSQLNLRLLLGGWLGGDALPLQRRVSVEGPGALPGFDFRSSRAGPDVGTCNGGTSAFGRPAECERMALAQIEYRGDLRLDVFTNWEDWPRRYHRAHGDAVWVVFLDAGRGWKLGDTDGSMVYEADEFPSFSTFRTDAGLGIDIGGIGIYVAKSLSARREPANFFLRLRHRL